MYIFSMNILQIALFLRINIIYNFKKKHVLITLIYENRIQLFPSTKLPHRQNLHIKSLKIRIVN